MKHYVFYVDAPAHDVCSQRQAELMMREIFRCVMKEDDNAVMMTIPGASYGAGTRDKVYSHVLPKHTVCIDLQMRLV